MQHINICGTDFSKIICGSNAFYGRSHFSSSRDVEYQTYFTDENIKKSIECCLTWGINTVETSANKRISSILSSIRLEKQSSLFCIGSTRIDETSDMKSHHQKLEYLIKEQVKICVIHSQYIDHALQDEEIPGLDRLLDKIHEAGLIAAISTHQVNIVELCERKKYCIDTYLFPLNNIGFVYPGYSGKESVHDRIDLIRNVAKPFILMKALGAGRIPPHEGLQFVIENSKPNDLISLGFGSKNEINETMEIYNKLSQ
jgi:hypothetical protein